MGYDLDVTNAESLNQVDDKAEFGWYKLPENTVKRIYFISQPWTEQIYKLYQQNMRDDSGKVARSGYRGTYRSLTGVKYGFKEVCDAIDNGDAEGILNIDAQVLGKPELNGAIPILIYPTDREGNLKKELFKNKAVQVEVAYLSKAKLKRLKKAAKKLDRKGKNIFEVDFMLQLEEDEQFPSWELEACESSYYKKNEKVLKPVVDGLLKELLKGSGVEKFEDIGKFMGEAMTEHQWHEKLERCGYIAASESLDSGDTLGDAFDSLAGAKDEEEMSIPADALEDDGIDIPL